MAQMAEARRDLRFGQPLGIGAQVEEAERVLGSQLRGLLLERAAVGELHDPRPRPDRKVVAAVLADAKVPLELVFPVVRPAGRARVRVRLLVRRSVGEIVMLDGNVDSRPRHAADYG